MAPLKRLIALKVPTRHRSAENVDLAIDMAAIAESAIRLSKTTTQTAQRMMQVMLLRLSLLLKQRRPPHVLILTVQ
jgi:hypothetical protein